MFRNSRQAVVIGVALIACGSPPAPAAPSAVPAPAEPDSELSLEPVEEEPPSNDARLPVQAGAYHLRMTAACPEHERTAQGRLTLKRISAADLPGGGGGGDDVVGAGAGTDLLLWGQTDLDVEKLEACSGPPPRSAKREPIHPNVLVEVLQWNGQSQRQVLLVSSDPKAAKGRRASSAAGVAMWVERSEQGHLAGVWCRWEVMNEGEGRWEADLVRADAP
ncbi:MAG: hypothetical protein ABI895_27415 [Deltaproteobacteria bacterium]